MLIETSISSIEAGLFYASEHRKQDSLCDWVPVNESCLMSPKCDNGPSQNGSEEDEYSCPLLLRTGSQQSSLSEMSGNRSPMPAFVYSRRKKRRVNCSSPPRAVVANSLTDNPVNSKRNGDCLSVVSYDALSEVIMERKTVFRIENENVALGVGDPVIHLTCGSEPCNLRYEVANECSVMGNCSADDVCKTHMQKTIDVDSINDSCSSSKSNMELAASMKGEMDENGECSSSSVIADENLGEDRPETDMYPSMFDNRGNAEEVGPSIAPVNEEISCSRFCKACGRLEAAQKMLICDNCEEAFHIRCCNPKVKKLPVDEWYCSLCMKMKCTMLKETIARNITSITGGIGRGRDLLSKEEFSPIELMLSDAEPYRTNVRIGKGFQAEVPDWSGPPENDIDTIGEPLELDPSEFSDFHELNHNNSLKSNSIGNWLQCRAFIEGNGGSNGAICGKWRRAPILEVQTDDWECFCSFQWDPSQADCSVPQELETDQILKQLKYIEMLRHQLLAKHRKSSQSKNC